MKSLRQRSITQTDAEDKMKTKEPIKVQIKGQVPFSVLLTKNSNYVGICEPLKLTLQANTFSNLMEDMALTLDAIFKDLLSSNELDKFLRDKGWKKQEQTQVDRKGEQNATS